MMDMWINFGEGFLLVFAINDSESFKILSKKRDRILKTKLGEHCKIETTIDEIVKYQSEKLNSVEQIVILISAGNNSQII